MTSMNRALQTFFAYKFVKLLVKDFRQWDAYKLGLIDANGKRLKEVEAKTTKEKQQVGLFMNLTRKLKRMLNKVPGGRTTFGSIIAASVLLKEECFNDNEILLTEDFTKDVIKELDHLRTSSSSPEKYKYDEDELYLSEEEEETKPIEPGAYVLKEEYREFFGDPLFYIKEEIYPDISFGFPLYNLRDAWGKTYWIPSCALKNSKG